MKITTTLLLPLILFPLLTSCQKESKKEAAASALTESRKQEMLKQGAEASSALLSSLGPKLKGALKSSGPEHALMICQQFGQPSTKEVSDSLEGLTLSRVSLKPRSPQNVPDNLDKVVLLSWEKQISSGTATPTDEVRVKDEKTAVFYRPIMTKEVCLKCHGDPDTFPAELKGRLATLYPKDKATGYSEGELRGAFRVEFPLKAE